MSTTFKPYTYLIGWSTLNKWYYGVQYGKSAHPNNLWNNYFTSSKYVKEFRKLYGEPDIIEVRKIFSNKEQAIRWEFKVIQRMKIVSSCNWLNRSLAGQKFYIDYHTEETKLKLSVANLGKKHTEESIELIRQASYGKLHTEETKYKISLSKKGVSNPMFGLSGILSPSYGKHHTEETKHKLSLLKKGELCYLYGKKGYEHPRFGTIHSEDVKEKMSVCKKGIKNPFYGKHHSPETKLKIIEANKKQEKFKCPYCHKEYIKAMFNRWHNDNCKLKE